MSDPRHGPGNQRGIALIVAMLVLLVLSMLALVLMTTANVDTKVAGHSIRETQALHTAEAGVSEAVARIASTDISLANNPRGVAQIFNTTVGSVPTLGTDSTGMATAQPAGAWLRYSTAARGPDVLTVKYKTNAARTLIYKYDSTKNPPVQTASGNPIFVVTSVGQEGGERKKIITEVTQRPIISNIKGALTTGVGTDFVGNAVVCGYNHRADTPSGTGNSGRFGVGGCQEDATHWETAAGDLPGAWSTGAIDSGGTSACKGQPNFSPNQTGFYAGPWESLGLSQGEFFSWIGAPITALPTGTNGIFNFDNDGTTQNRSIDLGLHSVTGSGLLYVDGNLHVNAGFVWKGLVYVEGDFDINGQAWILGAVICRGVSNVKMNGGATILYSSDAITQYLSLAGTFVTLSWHEE